MNCNVGLLAILGLLCLVLQGCGTPSEVMGGNFASLQQCLSSIQAKTGLPLSPVTDTPDNVSGYLGTTKRNFACTKKSSGTQGVYWEGWYDVQ